MANISSKIEGIISPSSTNNETIITLPFSTSDNVFFKDGKTLQFKYDNGELVGSSTGSKSKWYGKNILSFGDSITTLYPSIMCEILGAVSTNKGLSGGNYNNDWEILQGVGNLELFDAITIMTGHNKGPGALTLDTSGILDITDTSNYSLYPDNYYGGIGKIIEYIRANSNARIYLLTLHITSRGEWKNSIQCRKALFELGEYYSCPVIDVYSLCGIGKTNLSKYSTDLTHLNSDGQRLLGECIAYQMMHL